MTATPNTPRLVRAAATLLMACVLTSCQAIGGAAAGGGLVATAIAVNTDSDEALKVAKPMNQALCLLHPFNPKTPQGLAAVAAFCAHLPDSTLGLVEQIFAVVNAVDAAAPQEGK